MDFSPAIFTSVINGYLPEPQSSLLNGIIFGVDLNTTKGFYDQLRAVGLLHLVVLSGINITILSTLVGSYTIKFGKFMSSLITVLSIILFIIFVGPKAPIVRAGIMGILTYVAISFGRRNLSLYSLLISLVIIIVVYPKWLNTLSLKLSYAATLGIILFGQTTSRNMLIKDLRVSLAAQFFTAPIIFLYFKQISIISPVTNLLVSPFIPPLMIFGFITAFLGKINYLLGLIPSYLCYGILTYIVWVIELLSKPSFVFFDFK